MIRPPSATFQKTTGFLILLLCLLVGCNRTAEDNTMQQDLSHDSESVAGNRQTAEPFERKMNSKLTGEWPLFRGNTRSQGVSISGLPRKLDVVWQYEQKDGAFEGSPVVIGSPKQMAIIGDADGKLFAFNLEDGNVEWEYVSGEIGFVTAPAVMDGKIYIGDMDGKFHCIDLKGNHIWDFQADDSIDSSANFHENMVLFGSRDTKLYALDANTGNLEWMLETDDQVRCSMTVVDGRAFVAGCDGALHIIDVDQGIEIGNVVIESPTGVTPAAWNDRVFVGAENGGYFGIDWKKASIDWTFDERESSISTRSSPAVTDDHVIFGARNRNVYSIHPVSGNKNWATELKSDIDSSPVIVDDRVFVGSTDGRLYELELSTGKIVWEKEFNGQFIGSPAVGFGRLVIATNRGLVYCLGTKDRDRKSK